MVIPTVVNIINHKMIVTVPTTLFIIMQNYCINPVVKAKILICVSVNEGQINDT